MIKKKKIISMLLTVGLMCGVVMPLCAAGTDVESREGKESPGEYVEGRAIVKVTSEFAQAESRARAGAEFYTETIFTMEDTAEASAQQEGISQYSNDAVNNSILLVESEEMSTQELIQTMEAYKGVEYAEPDYTIYADGIPNDPLYQEQWHLKSQTGDTEGEYAVGAANVPYAWENIGTSAPEDVVVAVIDTGIDYRHPDIKDNMWQDKDGYYGYDFSSDADSPEGDTDPMDVEGHGTHVSGIIGARGNNSIGVSGVSQEIKLAAVRVLDDAGYGTLSQGIRAYQYILDKKAKGVNFVAANNSWGGMGAGRSMQEVMDEAGRKGVISVHSSGNEDNDCDNINYTPESGRRKSSLTVNASDSDGLKAYYSNYGQENTDLFAPGDSILSAIPMSQAVMDTSAEDGSVLWKLDVKEPLESWCKTATEPEGDADNEISIKEDVQEGGSWLFWEIESQNEGQALGVEISAGDLSQFKNDAKYMAFPISVTGDKETRLGRYLSVQIKAIGEQGYISFNGKSSSYESFQDLTCYIENVRDQIDWENFTVKITRTVTKADFGKHLIFQIGSLALGTEGQPYELESGTSMAAPAVTGAVALLSAKYGTSPEEMQEIRARIVGGVTRTEEMEGLCVSGGYLNLQKAIDNPYPVLDELSQEGNNGVLWGYFFGGTQGTLTMDGVAVDIISWTDKEIRFMLPDGTSEGVHQLQVTASGDENQYGRNSFQLTAVGQTPETQNNMFEKLPVPDYEKLKVKISDAQDGQYSMAAYDGKIYVMNGCFHDGEKDGEYAVILVYDEVSREWSKIQTSVEQTQDNKLVAVGSKLYLYFNDGNKAAIYDYDLKTMQANQLLKFESAEIKRGESFVSDGKYIWIVGGSLQRSAIDFPIPSAEVRRFNIETKKLEEMPDLTYPRNNPQAGIIDGKLLVTGGENEENQWEANTEIWDGTKWNEAAPYPDTYLSQLNMAACGIYDKNMISSGMISSSQDSDTYIYNMESNTWESAPQRLSDVKISYAGGAVEGSYFYVFGLSTFKGDTEDGFYRLKVREAGEEETNKQPEDGKKTETPAQDLGKDTKNKQVKTGDEAIPSLYIVIMALSSLMAAGAAKRIFSSK